MKKKILIFVQDGVGGAERMSVLIGKNLDFSKYDVRFYLVERFVKSSISDFIPDGMYIKRIGNKNQFHLIWNIVSTIIRERPYAVFSSVFNLSNKYLPFRRLFPKTKVIVRCDNYLYTYKGMQQKMITKFYPKADCIIAQTQEMKDELVLSGIDESKIVVLQNPIDKQTIEKKLSIAISPFPYNGRKHFVAVGRFNQQKGFDLLIDAFIDAHSKKSDIDLYIVGDNTLGNGEIFNTIMQKAKYNDVGDLVHCVGYKDNPYAYIRYADCFVLSSRWEGLPNVLIESLYLGTPAAAFKCIPIIERIIDEGVTGFCANKEDVKSLSDAMINTLTLGRIVSTYKSAEIYDFTKLFD
ncbi:MAG: glycosyltransferase [Paludibacteraceae bacterium]|nr:glycosyltransferase [Paludibacteraceae bacterium]